MSFFVMGSASVFQNKGERNSTYMEMNEFVQKVQKAVQKRVGEGFQVKIHEVRKNNNTIFHGLLILSERQNVSPTIYLDSFWEAYREGVTFGVIVEHIMRVYNQDTPKQNVDMSFFKEYDKVKGRICYKLISLERNAELLQKIPYLSFWIWQSAFITPIRGMNWEREPF